MVAEDTSQGLIATTHEVATPPLDELGDCCNWPVLLNANARKLHHELLLRCPACVLFWLEDGHGLVATARLIAWLRERGNRPYRVAAAYQLDDEAEATLRSAGVHSFLPIVESVSATIEATLLPLLTGDARGPDTFAAGTMPLPTKRNRRRADKAERGFVRPP